MNDSKGAMKRLLVVGRGGGSWTCAHVSKSGQLRFDSSGMLTAWLVCDDCAQTIGFMRDQTAELQQQQSQPRHAAAHV